MEYLKYILYIKKINLVRIKIYQIIVNIYYYRKNSNFV